MDAGSDPGAHENAPADGGPYDTGLTRITPIAAGIGIACGVIFSALSAYILYRSENGALLAALPPLLLALALYAVAIAALTLSLILSLFAALVLTLCFVWSFGFLVLAHVALDPPTIVAVMAVNTANALLVAQLIYGVVTDTCRDMEVDAAVGKNLKRWTLPGAIAVAAMLIPILALAPLEGDWVVAALTAELGTVLASTPVIFIAFPYVLDKTAIAENIIARANRWREWREHFLYPLAAIAVPRWAYAVCGAIAVVFAIVFFDGGRAVSFDSSTLILLWRENDFALALSLVASAIMGSLALRDWRAALVCALVPFVFASFGAWLILRLEIAPLFSAARMLVLGGGFGAGIAILLLDAIGVYRRFDDDVETALARAFYDSGPVILIVGLGLASSAAFFAARFSEAAGGGLMVLVETLGITIGAPCFAAVLEDIFWKRKSVEELYGRS